MQVRQFLFLAKALGDARRLRTLMALRDGELCVCQIIELLGLAPSTVSKHMAILGQVRLVDSRKEGRWVYYRLAGDDAPPDVREAIRWVAEALEGDDEIRRDCRHIKRICATDPEKLCRRQSAKSGEH